MAEVLIVDDEEPIRQLLTRWIQGAGHTTSEAESAETALEMMAKSPAAVVFCDVQMPPGHDGLWLTNELRHRYPTAAVVLATSVSTVAPVTSMQKGVLAYLVKPFSRHAVLDAVDMGLKWHEKTTASGPLPEDAPDKVRAWLDSLE